MSRRTAYWLAAVAVTAFALSVPDGRAEDARRSMDTGDCVVAEYVPGPVDTFPLLRFADGQVSLNDRCMVRQTKLNAKMPPVYVSGHPVGFC